MNAVRKQGPHSGTAQGVIMGGSAPKTGAQGISLKKVPDEYAKNLIGGIVVDINTDGLPVVQIYDRKLEKYRRFRWQVVDVWGTRDTALFEEVRE
jgi:hypothetical protein